MEDKVDFQKIFEGADNFGAVLAFLIVLLLFDRTNMGEIKEKPTKSRLNSIYPAFLNKFFEFKFF